MEQEQMDQEVPADTEVQTDQQQEQTPNPEANFMAGYEGTPTETPAEPEATAEEAPEPKLRPLTEDEYQTLMGRLSEIDAIKETHQKSFGTAFGKIGGIERTLNEVRSNGIKMPSKDKIDKLRNDLPEIAELFDDLAVMAAPPSQAAPDVNAIVEQARIQARNELRSELLADKHPDWRDVTNGQEFVAFAKAKGDDYMASLAKASQEWDHRTIGKALDEFKDSKSKAATRASIRRDRIESNVTPRGTPAPVNAPKSREDAFLEGFKQASR